MASELSIINTALAHLGEERQLTELDAAVPPREQRVAQMLLPDLRDALLRKHPWLCAETRAVLGRQPLAADADWKFKNAFLVPTDLLRLWSIEPESVVDDRPEHQLGPFTTWRPDGSVEARRRAIFCSHPGPLRIRYVARIDYEHLDACLAEAMALELAGRMAGPLQADKALQRQLADRAREALAYAVTVETSEFKDGPVRGGGHWLGSR